MMRLAIYNPATGEIRSVVEFSPSSIEDALLNIPKGCLAVEIGEGVTPATHYIDAEDEPREYPPRPGEWAVWTGTEWTDRRTEADREGERQARRAAAYLTKAEFIENCMAVNILTPTEAVEASHQIPASFEPVVSAFPGYEQTICRVRWNAVTRIARMDPLILAVAAGAGISAQTLDALFGLADYTP